jgi:uracil-DNA glycosylase
MSWSDRQQAMLRAMGLRVWAPVAAPPVVESLAAARVATPAVKTAGKTAAPSSAPAPVALATPVSYSGAIVSMDWPALREAVSNCRACSLCESRSQTVFGVGHLQAPWLIVGEAPGEQEDLRGEPFVGAAGQLLDRMLAALKLTRSEDDVVPLAQRAYITNTLKCRPPRNRNPTPQEMAQCEPYLMRQIELLQPRIILAMGRFAVQALLRSDEPIGRLRGRVHQYQGRPLVVTYHPAYLLRSPLDKAKAWDDLCLAANAANSANSANSAKAT